MIVELREAEASDLELLWHWRTDPVTVANSLSKAPHVFSLHRQWFEKTRLSSLILIAEVYKDGEFGSCGAFMGYGGVVRFDPKDYGEVGYSCEMSWTVAPPLRRMGIGKIIVKDAIELHRPNVTIGALIKHDNIGSEKIAADVGFERAPYNALTHMLWLKKPLGI